MSTQQAEHLARVADSRRWFEGNPTGEAVAHAFVEKFNGGAKGRDITLVAIPVADPLTYAIADDEIGVDGRLRTNRNGVTPAFRGVVPQTGRDRSGLSILIADKDNGYEPRGGFNLIVPTKKNLGDTVVLRSDGHEIFRKPLESPLPDVIWGWTYANHTQDGKREKGVGRLISESAMEAMQELLRLTGQEELGVMMEINGLVGRDVVHALVEETANGRRVNLGERKFPLYQILERGTPQIAKRYATPPDIVPQGGEFTAERIEKRVKATADALGVERTQLPNLVEEPFPVGALFGLVNPSAYGMEKLGTRLGLEALPDSASGRSANAHLSLGKVLRGIIRR